MAQHLPHYGRTRGMKVKHFPTRSRSFLQDTSNGEDSPEPLDSGSNSDNEVFFYEFYGYRCGN